MHQECYAPLKNEANDVGFSKKLKRALDKALQFDPEEQAGSFGRWWLDAETGEMVLSALAGKYLDVDAGLHRDQDICFSQVLPDDVLALTTAIEQLKQNGEGIDCQIRVIDQMDGMRWLRMTSLPDKAEVPGLKCGMLMNVTPAQQAAIRERLGFASTQILVGANTESEAITEVIKLVCQTLGWEWGAYWGSEKTTATSAELCCKHFWHDPAYALTTFTQESCGYRIKSGEGIIGKVWHSGQPAWIENLPKHVDCTRYRSIVDSGLKSGYAFPVTYLNTEGERRTPGVLEFCSSLPRQREAQLPALSKVIGELIAQALQKIEQTETIQRMAQTDEMTGLLNRSHFHHHVALACKAAKMQGHTFGVLYIDLDRFKPINDAYGHDVGNFLLIEFSRRLKNIAPEGSIVGRLGGDEFAILSQAGASLAILKTLAEKALNAASAVFMHDGVELSVSASIGISVYPENGTTTQELLRSSDAAMYRSKNLGGNLDCFYSGIMQLEKSAMKQKLTIEVALHRALMKNEFFLEYQPVYDCYAEKIVAVEALIRWRRANGEIVRPDVFIPIAEQSRLIVPIGRWVVWQACRDLAAFHRAGFKDLKVNINMAAAEFTNPSLPAKLMSLAEAAGVEPNHVCLELTESMVMQYANDVIPIMERLRNQGFHISIDDFGMGYSSLSRLRALPISSLKIDRSFVRGLPKEQNDCAIVQTIFDLAHRMKLELVVEGVETEGQLAYLRQFGYPMLQGFLLAKPMPAEAIIRNMSWAACQPE